MKRHVRFAGAALSALTPLAAYAQSTGVEASAQACDNSSCSGQNTGLIAPPFASASASSPSELSNASASIDESTGIARMSGSSAEVANSEVNTQVTFGDSLTVTEAGLATGQDITATFQLTVDGSVTTGTAARTAPQVDLGMLAMTLGTATGGAGPDGVALGSFANTYSVTGVVQDGEPFQIGYQMAMAAYDGTSFDFSHTAQMSLLLPAGATYTSASGDFLTASPVPIPGTVWLLLSGLAGVAPFARRKLVAH
jgi:hypothetical protein